MKDTVRPTQAVPQEIGADQLAGRIAARLGCAVEVYEADWRLGRRAGPERNLRDVLAVHLSYHGGELLIQISDADRSVFQQNRKCGHPGAGRQ